MKKIIFLFLPILLFCSVSFSGYSQKRNFVKVNLFSPLVKSGSFFYERVLNDDMSGQLGFFFTKVEAGDTKFSGFGITPEFRYYLSETAPPKGIFLAPYFRYQSFKLSVEEGTAKGNLSVVGGGLLVGAQTLLKDVITIEAFLGPAYGFGNMDVTSGSEDDFDINTFDGFGVRAGITVGIGF
ncbi:MAG: DUF3575 domain-containing protein [Bacteroidetes bacterium]|nr:DUF3575 domain-containing protein [Bacteroidota bacterium]